MLLKLLSMLCLCCRLCICHNFDLRILLLLLPGNLSSCLQKREVAPSLNPPLATRGSCRKSGTSTIFELPTIRLRGTKIRGKLWYPCKILKFQDGGQVKDAVTGTCTWAGKDLTELPDFSPISQKLRANCKICELCEKLQIFTNIACQRKICEKLWLCMKRRNLCKNCTPQNRDFLQELTIMR